MRISEIIHGYLDWQNQNDKTAEAYEEYVNRMKELEELRGDVDDYNSLVNYLSLHDPKLYEDWVNSGKSEAGVRELEPEVIEG